MTLPVKELFPLSWSVPPSVCRTLPVPVMAPLIVKVWPPYTRKILSPPPERTISRVEGRVRAPVATKPPPARMMSFDASPKAASEAKFTTPEETVMFPTKSLAGVAEGEVAPHASA
jgi:hypothetical protein